jgi:hypothetical protein
MFCSSTVTRFETPLPRGGEHGKEPQADRIQGGKRRGEGFVEPEIDEDGEVSGSERAVSGAYQGQAQVVPTSSCVR